MEAELRLALGLLDHKFWDLEVVDSSMFLLSCYN